MKSAVIALLCFLLIGASRAEEETTTLKDVATSSQVTTSDSMSTTPEKVMEVSSTTSQPSSTDAIATTLKVVVLNGPTSTPVKPFFLNDGPGEPVVGLVPSQESKELPSTSEAPKEMATKSDEVSSSTTITKLISKEMVKDNEDKVVITPESTEIKTTPEPSSTSAETTSVPREQRQADAETTTEGKPSTTEDNVHSTTPYPTIPPFHGTTPNRTAILIAMSKLTTTKPEETQTTIVPEIRALNTETAAVDIKASEVTQDSTTVSKMMEKESSSESSTEMSKEDGSTTLSPVIKLLLNNLTTKEDSKEEKIVSSSTETSSTSSKTL